MTFSPLGFDDLQVGQRWTSRARTITEADVTHFAGLTGDFDPLHVDHETARRSPFNRPIAHGLLGLSLMAGLSSVCPAMRTAAFVAIREWKFLKPLYFGDTVHAITEVVALQASGRRRGVVVWKRQLVNQNGEITQEGVLETLVEKNASRPPAPHISLEGAPRETPAPKPTE